MDENISNNAKVESLETEQTENVVQPVERIKNKKRSKEDGGKKKNENRATEQFFKALNNVNSLEERLELMCKKSSEIVEYNRKLQLLLRQSEKRMSTLQHEKEQLLNERSKAVLTRRKLESLCRELQKQYKAVKEESLLKIRGEEEKRKEVSAKFQSTLAELTVLMNQNIEKNAKLHEDNVEITKKFKTVYEQVEYKEQQLLKVYQQMKLDLQLAHKVKLEATAEKEALLKEKQQLLCKLAKCQAQIRDLQATEINLRSQISIYTDKYDEFQNTLTRSNKVYGEFNEEMEKMSKKILTLEEETMLWKQQWENSHAALLEMAADKQLRDAEIVTLSKKVTLLQDLCKVFQSERTDLLAQLKEKTAASQAATSSKTASTKATDAAVRTVEKTQTEVEENPKSIKQVDELSKDCLTLQNTFGQLQESYLKVSKAIQQDLNQEKQNMDVKSQKEIEETSQPESNQSSSTKENEVSSEKDNKECEISNEKDNEENEVSCEKDNKENEIPSGKDNINYKVKADTEKSEDPNQIKESFDVGESVDAEAQRQCINKLKSIVDTANTEYNYEEDTLKATNNADEKEQPQQSEESTLDLICLNDSLAEEVKLLTTHVEDDITETNFTSPIMKLEEENVNLQSCNEETYSDTPTDINEEINLDSDSRCNSIVSENFDHQYTMKKQNDMVDVQELGGTIKVSDVDSDKRLQNVENSNGSSVERISTEYQQGRVESSVNVEITSVDVNASRSEVSSNDHIVPIETTQINAKLIPDDSSETISEPSRSCLSKEEHCLQEKLLEVNSSSIREHNPEVKCAGSHTSKSGKRRKK